MSKKALPARTLQIKNMVCPRCILVVHETLDKLGFSIVSVELGKATVINTNQCTDEALEAELALLGFELLHNRLQEIAESVKVCIINLIHSEELRELNTMFSTYLAEKLDKEYSALSTSFKQATGQTIGRYFILQKIERAKELLQYQEKNLSEIAILLGYRSVQHLSNQFKEVTGVTPTRYKQLENLHRKAICDLI